jgi:hypothetical protein
MKLCKICLLTKPLSDFHSCGKYKDKIYYRGECIKCNNQLQRTNGKKYVKKYRSTEKYKQKRREKRLKEEYKTKEKEYVQRPEVKARRSYLTNIRIKERYKTDSIFKLKVTMRVRIYEALTRTKHPKKGSTFEYIGCDIHTLRTHLETQFKDNMSWDNYGEWHVDHIIPLSSAKNEEELIKLCHYTNLQPLWAIDNLKKSDKIL